MTAVACVSMWRVGDGAKAGDTLSYILGNSAVTAETDSKKSTGVGTGERGVGGVGARVGAHGEDMLHRGGGEEPRGGPGENSWSAKKTQIGRETTLFGNGKLRKMTRGE